MSMQKLAVKAMLAMLFVICAALVGCTKNQEQTLAQTIVGKWQLENQYLVAQVNGKDSLTQMRIQYVELLEIKSDGTYSRQTGSYTPDTGTWTLQDSTLNLISEAAAPYKVMQLDQVQLKLDVEPGDNPSGWFYFYIRK
jgi:hypothetical protein